MESEAEQFQADRVSAEQAVRMNRNSVHSCGSAASGMPNFTRKAIQEAFITLLNERPLKQITVKDIVDTCGIKSAVAAKIAAAIKGSSIRYRWYYD